MKKCFIGLDLTNYDRKYQIMTKEGPRGVDNLIKFIKKQTPINTKLEKNKIPMETAEEMFKTMTKLNK